MEGTASDTGDKFLESLVFNLAESLKMQFAFLGSWDGRVTKALAFWSKDKFQPSVEYDILGTPCEEVIKKNEILICLKDLQTKFPNHLIFKEF